MAVSPRGGNLHGDDPSTRQTQAVRADAELARVLAARPERSLVIVAGLADTDQSSRLHVAVADGPGWDGGWLTSASTGQAPFTQLIEGECALRPEMTDAVPESREIRAGSIHSFTLS